MLQSEVARRLPLSVAREGELARVVAAPQCSVAQPDVTTPIDVLRFDAFGFERVTRDAVWSVRGDGREQAHGRLLDALAADIAPALR